VPFNEFKNNPELLAKNVLQELPDQLVDYMTLVQRKPGFHSGNYQKIIKKEIQLNNFMLGSESLKVNNPLDSDIKK
jgi:hypothetical protein